MTNALALDGVVKNFGSVRALDGLDLSVATGEVHGFLGPNGAGKSTAIRVLLGLLRADGGSARLLDGDPWTQAADLHRRTGYGLVVDRRDYRPLWKAAGSELRWPLFGLPGGRFLVGLVGVAVGPGGVRHRVGLG